MPTLEHSFLCFSRWAASYGSLGERVLTAGEHSQASLWNARTGTKILSVDSMETDWLASVRMVAALRPHIYGRVFIWNAEDGALIRESPVGTYASTLTFSPDGSRLLVGSWGTIS